MPIAQEMSDLATGLGTTDVHSSVAISRLTESLDAAQRDTDAAQCQELLIDALNAFRSNHLALDTTLFELFGPVAACADLSDTCSSLTQAYLQLMSDHCSGREVLTLLMSTLDCSVG